MAYITEKGAFTEGNIPLLDTTTPVQGYDGTSIGPANEQAQVLGDRTVWLKGKIEETNTTVSTLTDTTEKIKLTQTSIEQRLTTVEDQVETVDKDSVSRDNKLDVNIQALKRNLDTEVSSLDYRITQLDHRESTDNKVLSDTVSALSTKVTKLSDKTDTLSTNVDGLKKKVDTVTTDVSSLKETTDQHTSEIQNLTITLGQATSDIADNKLAIHNIEVRLDDHDSTLLKYEDEIDTVKSTVDGLGKTKQDKLQSGTNINTVLGVNLENVKEGGITLADAKDFASVLKDHIAVGSGITLTESDDGQTLTLDTASNGGGGSSGSGLGTSLVIKKVTTRANQELEYRTPVRPTSYNLRAYAFKATTTNALSNLTINFSQNPSGTPTSPWDSDGMRISFLGDPTQTRWSSVNTLSIDASQYSSSRVAFSPDGVNWYTYVTSSKRWVSLGELTTTKDSAILMLSRAMSVSEFNSLDATVMQKWLSSMENPPALNVAFAASGLSDESHRFVPASMSATFNSVSSWTRQADTAVPVTITPDSIIFKTTSAGDYVLCYELLK